jgi:hypothetical protein
MRLVNGLKVACGAFSGQRLRFRQQKAWFLPAALSQAADRGGVNTRWWTPKPGERILLIHGSNVPASQGRDC